MTSNSSPGKIEIITMSNKPHLPEVLTRGVEQVLPDASSLAKLMAERKIRLYLGIDPTGNQLTLGHSVVLRKLQQFAELDHHVILLIGNGTVKIGDPTGKDTTRPMLTDADIEANFQTWKAQASKVLDFARIEIRYNGDWLDKLTYADLVKLLAQTTVQQLLERDMFQERMKKELPIFGHEIIYPLLQGYDSVVMDVDLEIGGSDQTFNMLMGRTLQRQMANRDKWVLSTPIIAGTDGRKMSKSYGNFIALTENPTDMYGKLMRLSDDQILPYFTTLTDISQTKIMHMQAAMEAGENPMQFKKDLAKTITTMYHDQELASKAEQQFEQTIQQKLMPKDAQVIKVVEEKLPLIDLLVKCQPDQTKTNLKRLIAQSAVELLPSHDKPTDPQQLILISDLTGVRIGKRQYYQIQK